MNTMVGSRNARAVSPSPRRLRSGDEGQDAEADRDGGGGQAGKAEVSAPTPAAMDTATVSV